jgi:glycine/D-amino acid oxidase-like deaminating enzyme
MSGDKGRVVVVGAGIVGTAIARALTREGLRPMVIDPRPVGSGATAAGMGHIPVMDDSEAQFALCRYSQSLWDEVADRLPKSVEFERCGTLWVAADDEEMGEVHRKKLFYDDRGLESRVLDAAALAKAEPNLRPGLVGGLVIPRDQVIYPPTAARFFLDEAVKGGAEAKLGVAVSSIEGRSVTLATGATIEADAVVNAAGWQATRLTPGLQIRPRKGHLVITDRYPGYLRHQVLELGYLKSAHSSDGDSVAFNVQPRQTGQLLVGSSRQFDVSDPKVDRPILERMVSRAIEYMPGLASLSTIRIWTGFRAATPDSLPIIGPHPDHPGLFLATGHEGLGIGTSLGTAELVVDQILGRASQIPAEPYWPSRLATASHHG